MTGHRCIDPTIDFFHFTAGQVYICHCRRAFIATRHKWTPVRWWHIRARRRIRELGQASR